jgi:hypothetical protein
MDIFRRFEFFIDCLEANTYYKKIDFQMSKTEPKNGWKPHRCDGN